MPTPEYHAKLAPSAAARWIHCPASVALTVDKPDEVSAYAEAGRLAHSIAELKARKYLGLVTPRTYQTQLKALRESPHYEKVMDDYTDCYVEVIAEQAMSFEHAPFTALETQVPIGIITGEKKDDGSWATGTADCIQIGCGFLWVTDYKNGSGVKVSAEKNPQMMLYALGALYLYRPLFGNSINTVRMTIVQPALNNVTMWEIPRKDLEDWAMHTVLPAAMKALAGLKNPAEAGDPVPGPWCRSYFCPLRHTCRALAYEKLAIEAFQNTPPAELTPEEIADILRRGDALVSWYNDLKDYALSEILAGREIPGWKAVEGRGSRAWGDVDAAFAALVERGIDEALLWERKPVTAPALEKALGKKAFAEVAADLVVQQPGKPTLAPESDKRPPYNPAAAAFGKPVQEQ